MGRTENLSTDPGSKFRSASFLKNQSKFQNAVYMPKIGRTENLNTDLGSKFRGASFLFFAKTSVIQKCHFSKKKIRNCIFPFFQKSQKSKNPKFSKKNVPQNP